MPQNALGQPESTIDPSDLTVRLTLDLPPDRQTEALLICGHAVRADGDSIGWLPWQAYTMRHERRELIVAHRNGDLVGFVLMSTVIQGELRCLQVWVRRDARLLIHGRALVTRLEQLGIERGAHVLRCWVAEDLAANFFWTAIGFKKKCWRWGSGRSQRKQFLYTRPIERENHAPSGLVLGSDNTFARITAM